MSRGRRYPLGSCQSRSIADNPLAQSTREGSLRWTRARLRHGGKPWQTFRTPTSAGANGLPAEAGECRAGEWATARTRQRPGGPGARRAVAAGPGRARSRLARRSDLAPRPATQRPGGEPLPTAPAPPPWQGVALDGKELRGVRAHGRVVPLVSLVRHDGTVRAQTAGADKAHESTAAPARLRGRDRRGPGVTVAALLAQQDLARQIRQPHGHHRRVSTANQPAVSQAIARLFAEPPEGTTAAESVVRTVDRAPGGAAPRNECGVGGPVGVAWGATGAAAYRSPGNRRDRRGQRSGALWAQAFGRPAGERHGLGAAVAGARGGRASGAVSPRRAVGRRRGAGVPRPRPWQRCATPSAICFGHTAGGASPMQSATTAPSPTAHYGSLAPSQDDFAMTLPIGFITPAGGDGGRWR